MTGRKLKEQKIHVYGVGMGLFSGFAYGIYTTLVMIAGELQPLAGAAGFLAAPYVCAGLNDLLAGIWLTCYNGKRRRIREVVHAINTAPGKMVVLGALLGGPAANGAYLAGLSMAGAYAIPVTATCNLFGALFAWIFLKQRPSKKVMAGMCLCAAGAIIINWTKPEGSPHFTPGIICAFIAAVSWGLEGVIAGYGGAKMNADIAVNIRDLVSGIVILAIIVPAVGAAGLLKATLAAGTPVLWLAASGMAAAMSFLAWYRANAAVGCAVGMSLNVTYTFWGVLFCMLFLGQPLTATIAAGSAVIMLGAAVVAAGS
ncbi:MAG: DMT family transporter [Hungatella sp.]|nr:DMT family transporter [Hungatella sp.]